MKPEIKWLEDYLDQRELIPEMDRCLNLIMNWACMTHKYESKQLRLEEWNPTKSDVYAILCHILIGCFIHGEMTYQAMIGFIANDFNHNDKIDRFKTAAEVIALAYQCDLIVITKSEDYMMITTEFELDEELPDFEKHKPEIRPYIAEHNQILGCGFKQHDEDTCLSHINTMNAIPLILEWRVINTMEELNSDEEVNSTDEWKDFKNRSRRMYEEIGTDKFYLKHLYDTRGRTYSQGYYVNPQGTSYKKSIVQLYNKEIIPLT
jgi:hypothetical protein